MTTKRLALALLVGLLLGSSSSLAFSQDAVPGGGFGPAPEPTPGQAISVGAGNYGGGIGPVPAPTPGQVRSIGPGNVSDGIGPMPAPTPGQVLSRTR
jgi:hypothetical protein